MRKLYFTLVVADEELADPNQLVKIELEGGKAILAPVIKMEFDDMAGAKIMQLISQTYTVI